MQIKKKINQTLFPAVRNVLIKNGYYGMDEFANYSFSQMGEDRILEVLFPDKKNGFYVDIGAFHPKLYSNTYSLYLRGWKGINIDPNLENIALFKKVRPRDLNLGIAVGNNKTKNKYYIFTNPAVNTLSSENAKKIELKGEHKLIKTEEIETQKLSDILDKNLPKNKQIDFINIDCEGRDLEVLKSNNWNKYCPRVILVEEIGFEIENKDKSEVYVFLKTKGYRLKSKTNETLIFIKK